MSSGGAVGQEVPIDMSLAIADSSGANLAVRFTEEVTREEALALLNDRGYEIASVDFNPVTVFGECHDLMTDRELEKIAAHEKIRTVDQRKFESPRESSIFGDLKVKLLPRVLVNVQFEDDVSERQARGIANLFKEFNVKSVSSASRDVSIIIDEDAEDQVIKELEALDEVEYVVFLLLDQNPILN